MQTLRGKGAHQCQINACTSRRDPRGWPQGEAPALGPDLLMNLMPSSGQIHRGSKKLGQVRGTWGNSGLPHITSRAGKQVHGGHPATGHGPMWKRGRKQDSVSLTHHPHSLYSSTVCDCGSSGPAVWPCAACSSPQAFDPEAVFFEPVYVLVTHHNLAFEILSAPCPYSCSTNYTAKPHSQLR